MQEPVSLILIQQRCYPELFYPWEIEIAYVTFCVIGQRYSQLVKPGDQHLYGHLVHQKSF